MKHLISFVLLALALFFGTAHAADVKTSGEVKRDLIGQLQKDGMLTAQQAAAAVTKYATDTDQLASVDQESKWMKWLSLANFIKAVAIIVLLIAFHGLITKLIKGVWHLIASVPVEAYQSVLGGATLLGLLRPELIYPAQFFYVALFCAFAFPMVLIWFIETHPAFAERLTRFFNVGIPIACVASAYATAYFTLLAFAYHSQIFGFFAVVGFAGITTFGMTYSPGVLTLNFKEPALPAVVFGHIALIAGYLVLSEAGASWLTYFRAGVEYYATIALGVALLCGASPWWDRVAGFYSLLMLAAFGFACYAFNVMGFPVIGSILIVFFVLWFLEWLMYVTFSAHWLVGLFTLGVALWFAALSIENYGHNLVFKLVV